MTLVVKAEGKGFEPSTGCPAPDFESVGNREIPEENGHFPFGAAVGAAAASENPATDADLQEVIRAWPKLPEALRAGILAMVRTAGGAA